MLAFCLWLPHCASHPGLLLFQECSWVIFQLTKYHSSFSSTTNSCNRISHNRGGLSDAHVHHPWTCAIGTERVFTDDKERLPLNSRSDFFLRRHPCLLRNKRRVHEEWLGRRNKNLSFGFCNTCSFLTSHVFILSVGHFTENLSSANHFCYTLEAILVRNTLCAPGLYSLVGDDKHLPVYH